MKLEHCSFRAVRRPLLCAAATALLTLTAGTAAAEGYPYGVPTPVDGSFSCKDFDTQNLLTELSVVPADDGIVLTTDGTLEVVTIHYPSTNGFILDWIQMIDGPSIHHVVVRNAYGANAYSYEPPRLEDRGVRAPGITAEPTPESDNAVKGVTYCYSVPRVDVEGCRVRYWKANKNHDSWPSPYTTTSSLRVSFGPGAFNDTLLTALKYKRGPHVNGGKRILLKQAVASLLNSASGGVAFPLTTTQVVQQVKFALNTHDRDVMLALASTLKAYNNQGCPLN